MIVQTHDGQGFVVEEDTNKRLKGLVSDCPKRLLVYGHFDRKYHVYNIIKTEVILDRFYATYRFTAEVPRELQVVSKAGIVINDGGIDKLIWLVRTVTPITGSTTHIDINILTKMEFDDGGF